MIPAVDVHETETNLSMIEEDGLVSRGAFRLL